jgi:DNA modification methylase
MNYELHNGDCLEVMATLPDNSVDAVLTDPPYGTTACKWDSVIPFEPMWRELKRIAKPKAAVCLFGAQPFTSLLVGSNLKGYRHQWTWDKKQSGSFQNAKFQPLKVTEEITVFSCEPVRYFPQMRNGKLRLKGGGKKPNELFTGLKAGHATYSDQYYPVNILQYPNCANKAANVHPTQKPVDLLRYLVRTYTQEGETVLDFTMGSGTTGVACQLENRRFIGIEKDAGYFEIAKQRIEQAVQAEPLFA